MNEEQFWGSIFLVIRRLFLSDEGQIPDVDSSIARCRCEDGRIMRRPCQMEDFVGMRFEGVQFFRGCTNVVQYDSLICMNIEGY